jgi:hypothetical protein
MSKLKLVALVLALVLILPVAVMAAPQAGDIVFTVGDSSYWSGGQLHWADVPPVIIDNQVYVPLRSVADALGMKIT